MYVVGLVMKLCLLNGECHETVPESYTTLGECEVEVVHQRAQGAPDDMFSCKIFDVRDMEY